MLVIDKRHVGTAQRPTQAAAFAESHLREGDLLEGIPYQTKEERVAATRQIHEQLQRYGIAESQLVVNAVDRWLDKKGGIPEKGVIFTISRAEWAWARQMKEDARKMQRAGHRYSRENAYNKRRKHTQQTARA